MMRYRFWRQMCVKCCGDRKVNRYGFCFDCEPLRIERDLRFGSSGEDITPDLTVNKMALGSLVIGLIGGVVGGAVLLYLKGAIR